MVWTKAVPFRSPTTVGPALRLPSCHPGRAARGVGGRLLLGDQEKIPGPGAVSPADATCQHGNGNGQDQRADDRRYPPEISRVEPEERQAPGAGEQTVEAVMPNGFALTCSLSSRPCDRHCTVRPEDS